MNKILKVALAAAVVVAVGFSGAYAGDNYSAKKQDMEKNHQERFEKMCKELNITAEQKQQLKANREQMKGRVKNLHEAMKSKWQELKKKLDDPKSTRASVEPLVNEIKSLKSQLIDLQIDRVFSLKEILTPEQYQQFRKKMEDKISEYKNKHCNMMKKCDSKTGGKKLEKDK